MKTSAPSGRGNPSRSAASMWTAAATRPLWLPLLALVSIACLGDASLRLAGGDRESAAWILIATLAAAVPLLRWYWNDVLAPILEVRRLSFRRAVEVYSVLFVILIFLI